MTRVRIFKRNSPQELEELQRRNYAETTIDCYIRAVEDFSRYFMPGFDVNLVGFRENEEKDWDIREIIQRMACFLKDRWKFIQPTSMYKSKGKAL